MKKLSLSLIIFVLFCISCSGIYDIRRKKSEGQSTVRVYNRDWNTVYDAVSYVMRNSRRYLLSWTDSPYQINFAKEEKVIWIKAFHHYVDMGIFFEPQGESKTVVTFVKGYGPAIGAFGDKRIILLIEETDYFLKNGEWAYQQYTKEKRLDEIRESTIDESTY